MGVKSTHAIKRSDAIAIVLQKVNRGLTDHELCFLLEQFEEESYFRNYCIVDDDDPKFIRMVEENNSDDPKGKYWTRHCVIENVDCFFNTGI